LILDSNWVVESLRKAIPDSIENLIIFSAVHYFETKESSWKKETRTVEVKVSTKTLVSDQELIAPFPYWMVPALRYL
jgi:hypothetical protein